MKTALPRYAEYKDANLPWMPQVPAHWQVVKAKHIFAERSEKGFPNEPLLAATQTKGVILKSAYGTRTVEATKDFHLLKLVERSDFVISLRSFEGGIEFSHARGIISPAYTVLTIKSDELVPGYYAHVLKSQPFIQSLTLFVTGIREGQNIDYGKLSQSSLPIPSWAEQRAIATFLDAKTRQIARFVRNKRRLIALLQEQKQAIIHRAVTRGLDADAPLKDSGVEWLGEVPAHWEVSRVKTEFYCLNYKRIPLSSPERGLMKRREYDYYGASGVIDKVDDYIFDDDLLLIAEDGANLVSRNLPLAITARGRFWVNNHAHILKPKRGSIDYLAHLMEDLDYNRWISGAAQPKLTMDRLMAISIPVPPPEDQPLILQQIRKQTANLTEAIARTEREITLIQEYRTRLIADVVTGQVDVRGQAAARPALYAQPREEEAEAELLLAAEAGIDEDDETNEDNE